MAPGSGEERFNDMPPFREGESQRGGRRQEARERAYQARSVGFSHLVFPLFVL